MNFLHSAVLWLRDATNGLALFGALIGGLGLYLRWRGNHRRLRATFRVEAPLDEPRYEPYLVCEVVNRGVPVTVTYLLCTNTRDHGTMISVMDKTLPKRLERFEKYGARLSGSGFYNRHPAELESIFFKTECGLLRAAKRKTVKEWNVAIENMVNGTPPRVWTFMRASVRRDGKPLPSVNPDHYNAAKPTS